MKRSYLGLILIVLSTLAMAQPEEPQQPPPPAAPPPPLANHPPMGRGMRPGPPGRWWNNPDLVQKLALTPDQQKRIEDLFQQNRLKLIDLNASLQKEETIMEPLMSAEQPDESRILSQIDRVTQARAELEKANARMLFGMRRILTADQWKKLQAETPPRPEGPPPPGGPRPPRR